MMFKIPIESIKKGSDVRQKGKIAELALGFGGSLGALERMGGASMGLNQQEMRDIVKRWRIANPNIVELWNTCDEAAIEAILHNCAIHLKHGIVFDKEDDWLTIKLPSGRKLYYFKPKLGPSKMGATHSILYHDYSQKQACQSLRPLIPTAESWSRISYRLRLGIVSVRLCFE